MNTNLPNYSLGSSQAEHRRLITLAAHEEDHVVEACRKAGIGTGATVLDLGCGPLGALHALARVVGPTGSVIGVDASSAAVTKAKNLLQSPDLAHVRVVRSNVNDVTVSQLGIEAADLAYCRLMLLHQSRPLATLKRMASLLRPGGVVIAHEPSDLPLHAPAAQPPVPAMTRVWELVIAAARARGADTGFGRKGGELMQAAGLSVESHGEYAVHYPPETGYEIPRVALNSLRPVLAEFGLASEDEIQALDRELVEAEARRDAEWVSSPRMFEWIGRKVR